MTQFVGCSHSVLISIGSGLRREKSPTIDMTLMWEVNRFYHQVQSNRRTYWVPFTDMFNQDEGMYHNTVHWSLLCMCFPKCRPDRVLMLINVSCRKYLHLSIRTGLCINERKFLGLMRLTFSWISWMAW